MKTTHTPGPWRISMKPGPMIYGNKGEQVADLRVHWLIDDEHNANVRLIAAAPDLIVALSECITDAGSCAMSRHAVGDAIRRLEAINEIARAALAKARGE